MELSLLQSHANEMGNETQKFSQELASEIALGQGLSKKVTFLKSEFSKLKTDLQKLTEMKSSSQFMERNIKKSDHVKKVKWVDGVLLVEDHIRNLKEKVYVGSHEPDLSFFENIRDILNNLTSLTTLDLSNNNLTREQTFHVQNNQLTGTLNLLARLPLNDKYSKHRFRMDPKEASSILLLIYDEKSFDNGPAPPPPPFTPPPPGKSHNNRSRSPPSGSAFFIALVLSLIFRKLYGYELFQEFTVRPSFFLEREMATKVNAEMQEQRVITTASIVDLKVPPTENSTFEQGKSGSTKRVKSPITTSSYIVATLQTTTNSFSQDNTIGEGSLGGVYRADFPNAKSANSLLDEELNPHLSDCGLAALTPNTEREVATQLVGSFSYSAPEFALSGIYTVKSKVKDSTLMMMNSMKRSEKGDINIRYGIPTTTVRPPFMPPVHHKPPLLLFAYSPSTAFFYRRSPSSTFTNTVKHLLLPPESLLESPPES
ncbi:protein STRUBBELIG-receptor family 8 [Tanacetum coccineum]